MSDRRAAEADSRLASLREGDGGDARRREIRRDRELAFFRACCVGRPTSRLCWGSSGELYAVNTVASDPCQSLANSCRKVS